MKIVRVQKGGFAEEIGLLENDDLVSINGHVIHDPIDFQFWAHDEDAVLLIRRGAEEFEIEIEGGLDGSLDAEFAPMQYRCCGNECIFCFVDQNPPGLRPSLYFKDEDYRLSFLYGNYVTLTNVSQRHLQRIVDQRLSPIYISVHAADSELRKRLLGIKGNDRLLQKIGFLAEHRIEMHAQIVLCPGLNDGERLDHTVDTLSQFHPWLKTVAVVPVGLTKHRQSLSELTPVDGHLAAKIIRWSDHKANEYLHTLHSHFVYIADEFYLLAKEPLPEADRYEDFAQIENGVGLTRDFLLRFEEEKQSWPTSIPSKRITIVTGVMAESVLRREVEPFLQSIRGLGTEIVAVRNDFYGGNVAVSGLLVGQDIAAQLHGRFLGHAVFLPPNCLNHDGLFLDDWSLEKLAKELGTMVIKPEDGFLEAITKLMGPGSL